jgi:hypothetical protein
VSDIHLLPLYLLSLSMVVVIDVGVKSGVFFEFALIIIGFMLTLVWTCEKIFDIAMISIFLDVRVVLV